MRAVPALLADNADMSKGPADASALLATMPDETGVCVATAAVGLGSRRVWSRGLDGYVTEASVSRAGDP